MQGGSGVQRGRDRTIYSSASCYRMHHMHATTHTHAHAHTHCKQSDQQVSSPRRPHATPLDTPACTRARRLDDGRSPPPRRAQRLRPTRTPPAQQKLLFSIGIPYFLLPNLDSVNFCTNKEISMEMWKSEISMEMFLAGTKVH